MALRQSPQQICRGCLCGKPAASPQNTPAGPSLCSPAGKSPKPSGFSIYSLFLELTVVVVLGFLVSLDPD